MSAGDPAPDQSAWLLQQVQQGDEAAAEAIFERYAERLTRLARSRLSARLAARVDADDIVMSAYRSFFVAAREGRFTHQRGGDLWRLLVEVTLHKLYRQVEHHRAQRRSIDREECGSVGGAALQGFAVREPTPDEALAAAEELEAVLNNLGERGGQALELRLQGYEQEEIAARLGCTERTVRRWLADARRILAARGGTGFVPSAARRPPPEPPTQRATARHEVAINAPLAWSDYVLQEQIGAGASGKVYRAVHRSSNKQFAVKFLRKALLNEPGTIERFAREAATVAGLHHPGIVPIHGMGRSPGGGYFLVMDLIEGADLDRVTRERRLEARQAAALVAGAARVVHFANEQGVIHCDLKPSNLLLAADGQVRVTDFGLAVRPANDANRAALFGTPAFMAPEQVDACWGSISPRTDVWGLGAVLYFLVFAIPPHIGRGPGEVLSRVVSGKPVEFPVAQLASVPEAILDVLRRALAKRPDDRFASCDAVAEALSPVSRHNG